jgi:hypothetical protein
VAHVPDHPVARAREHVVEREGQLDDAQTRRKVPSAASDALDDHLANFVGDLRELLLRNLLQVLRGVDPR